MHTCTPGQVAHTPRACGLLSFRYQASAESRRLLRVEPRESVASENRLRHGATEREHGQSAVSELLHLHLLLLGRVRDEANRVEAVVAGLAARAAEHLIDGNGGEKLEHPQPQEQLAHRAVGHTRVVRLQSRELIARKCVEVGEDQAHKRQHGDAAVLQLSLTQPVHGQDLGETERIEAHVTDVALELWPLHEEGQRLGILHRRRRRRGSCFRCSSVLFCLSLHEDGTSPLARHRGARHHRRRREP
mmetsp:Transcript_1468/g.2917  ORF Transcript_1468/g.2917 Transcript_1468/m.2917 type:complete len:246 (+) Transcript_1468:66-803(+)